MFDSPQSATFDHIHIYTYILHQAQVCDVCIYMYIQLAPLPFLYGVSFIFIKRIRPEQTQDDQDELVNHGSIL